MMGDEADTVPFCFISDDLDVLLGITGQMTDLLLNIGESTFQNHKFLRSRTINICIISHNFPVLTAMN